MNRISTIETNDNFMNIEIVRKQEYLLQLKSEVKFPLFEKLKKFCKLSEEEEFKHHTKVKIIKESETLNEEAEEVVIPAFIFVFVDKIIFTHDWIEKIDNSNKLAKVPINKTPLIQTIDYAHFCVFSLTVNMTTPNGMTITYYDQTFNNKLQCNFKFIFLKDSYCVHHFIKKYYVLVWQKLFESTILFDFKNLIYNKHFILIKYNRWKKKQERLLLITNGLIFNLGHILAKDQLDFKKKKIKWADPIIAIEKIIVDTDKGNQLQLTMNHIKATAGSTEIKSFDYLKFKGVREFEFFSNEERNEFISLLRKNFYDLNYYRNPNAESSELYLKVELKNPIVKKEEEKK